MTRGFHGQPRLARFTVEINHALTTWLQVLIQKLAAINDTSAVGLLCSNGSQLNTPRAWQFSQVQTNSDKQHSNCAFLLRLALFYSLPCHSIVISLLNVALIQTSSLKPQRLPRTLPRLRILNLSISSH